MTGLATLPQADKITDDQLADIERAAIQEYPFALIEQEYLQIKTKAGSLISLKLNPPQKIIYNKIQELRKAKKPARLIILKFRQGGVCLSPDTKILTANLKWVEIDDILIGQHIIAVDENVPGGRGKGRRMRTGIVEKKRDIIDEAFKITMEDGRTIVATGEHRFLSRKRNSVETEWRHVKDMRIGDVFRHITYPWGESNYEDGWFGGMIDGEGAIRKIKTRRTGYDLKLTQLPGVVYDRMRRYMLNNGYAFREYIDKRPYQEGGKFSSKPVLRLEIGRMDELFRLIGKTRPSKLINKLWWQDKALPCRGKGNEAWIKIVNIEFVGRQRMIDLQTSNKTFIAEGIVSHNSTEIEAILYALTSQQPNRNSLIMADEIDKSNYLFEISKLYQEKLTQTQPHLTPPLKKSNEKKLEWSELHSQIIIDTAKNVDATRAYTYQYVHLSEGAFFPDLAGVLKGLQGVPDYWDTLIAIESTANGYGDEFHKLWTEAIKGHNEWTPIFLGWFIMPEYSLPLAGGEMYPLEGIEFDTDEGLPDFLKEEKTLQATYGLTQEQLNWRRYAIVNKCNRKVSSFREEYPANAEEAFLVTGGCVFDVQKLKKQKEKNTLPLAIGNLVELDHKVVFRPDAQGHFRVYEVPFQGMSCVIGADTAEGIEQDFHAACALDRATNNTIMTCHTNDIDVDQFEIELAKMGKFLNYAVIGPESFPSATGYSVTHGLNKIYGNVFKMILEDEGTKKLVKKLGWYNNKKTRRQAIDQFIEEVREEATELRCPILINQCFTFVQDPDTGKIAAQKNCHDDMVMARIIAGKLRQLYPQTLLQSGRIGGDYGIERRAIRRKVKRPTPDQ